MKTLLFLCGLVLVSLQVLASGLDLDLIHGTRYISLGGNQVAIAKDAYAPFYNPAGMTSVESGTFALNLNNLVHQYGAPIGADNAQRKSQWNWGPLFYMGGVYRALDRLALGFAVFPTALQGGKFSPVDYGPAGTPLSNLELSNKLVRIEAAPTIAVKVIEHLSLGLSYRIAYTRYDKAGGIFSSVAGANAVHFDSTLTGWDFDTFKAGLMLDNWYGFSAALTYRTEGKVKLTGDTTVTTFLGADRVHAEQELNLPSQIQFGLSYDWLPKKLMTAFTYEYTINNVLETDTMTTAHPLVPVVSVPIYYRNGHSFHLGSEYVFNLSGDQNLRTGVGGVLAKTFTQSRYANAILPPASSYLGGALGAQYEVEHQTFGWSFNYGRYEKRVAAVDPTLAGQSFAGKYALDVYLISVDYQYHF